MHLSRACKSIGGVCVRSSLVFKFFMFPHTGTYVGLEIDLDDVAEVCVCVHLSQACFYILVHMWVWRLTWTMWQRCVCVCI